MAGLTESDWSIQRIPKKKTRFNTLDLDEKHAWGLCPVLRPKYLIVVFYHVLFLADPFGFWIAWQLYYPGDVQNASVPSIIALGLLSLFWTVSGLLPAMR